MTHLTPDEFVSSLDNHLPETRRAHLVSCDECREQLSEVQAMLQDVTVAGAVPEPSPLFWDHFSAHVREAVDAQPIPAAMPWWQAAWRPFAATVATVGCAGLVLALALRHTA